MRAPHRHTLCCFPLLGMEKALHGSGKRALNLPGAITHRPAEVPLQRGSRGSSLLQTASQHQEKTTLHKKPLAAPKQLSACAESELPTAGAVGTHLSRATGRGQPRRAAGEPCVPGMQPKLQPEASFTLCIFSFRHAAFDFFFFQLRRQSFNPTKTCNFSNALKTDPQLQRPTPCPKPGRNETAWD